jgi:hypothetical protein
MKSAASIAICITCSLNSSPLVIEQEEHQAAGQAGQVRRVGGLALDVGDVRQVAAIRRI